MKIIRLIDRRDGEGADAVFQPDCALTLEGRPMFYPDFGGTWSAVMYVAVRVCRLGKGVSMKFASRYYDALAVALSMIPGETDSITDGWLAGMDGTITHGTWLPPEDFFALGRMTVGENVSVELTGVDASLIDSTIHVAAAHTTLRMGDMIMIPINDATRIALAPRTRLKVTAVPDGRELMNVKIV